MDERKFMILQAIIDDYITTAVPVGSRTISRKSGVGYSPATIRNEMSDLEELGYLAQPHTSAGRVPSCKAYRLYVDQLLNVAKLPMEEKERMNSFLTNRTDQVEALIRRAAAVISDATHYTSVIVSPQLNTLRIRNLQMVPVSDTLALMVIVTNAGIVKDTVIRVPEGISPDVLYEISKMLTEQLADKPIEQVRQLFAEIIRDMGDHRRLLAEAMQVIEDKMARTDYSDVIIGGGANMLSYPEYQDIGKAQEMLTGLDEEIISNLPALVDPKQPMQILVGPENVAQQLKDTSVVMTRFDIGDGMQGMIGVVGPTRMDYAQITARLSYFAEGLARMFGKPELPAGTEDNKEES